MADTFLVLRTNDTSPQLYFHNGVTIDPSGLGALPLAALENTGVIGRSNIKHNNRATTLLDMIFVIQDSKIYVSTDEGATFTLDFTFTAVSDTFEVQAVGPIPVMASGALKLVGFFMDGNNDIYTFEYDVAADTWSNTDTGVNVAAGTAGMSAPVAYNGLVYARVGDQFLAYDPVSTGTVTLTGALTGASYGADHMLVWNGDLWAGPYTDATANMGMARLQGSTWDVDTQGVTLNLSDNISPTSKAGVFVDPNTDNLIVMGPTATGLLIYRVTPGLVVTDITATVKGPNLTTLGNFGADTRIWPHVTRSPGGNYTVNIYASRGGDTTDPVERFTWVDDASNFTELGVVGGSGDMAFPYATHGGDYNGFFPGEKRVVQTAEVSNTTGITITCEAYQQSGGTLSVRGHYDQTSVSNNNLTLDPMTVSNPTGTGGLSVSGANPGAQIDGVPANRTAVNFDWNQATDGFSTGDPFSYQLEAL